MLNLPDFETNILFHQYEEFGLGVAEKSTIANPELAKELVEYLLEELNYFLDDDWADAEMDLAMKWFDKRIFAVDYNDNGMPIENLAQLLKMREVCQ